MTRITKLQRWLDLIAYLAGRRLPVAVEELVERIPSYAEKWETGSETDRASVRRTFERDKDELRKAGIPIETVEYQINYGTDRHEGYVLKHRDFYLPYLELVNTDPSSRRPSDRPYHLPDVQLTEQEAELALGALREVAELPSFPFVREARSEKLTFDLDQSDLGGAPVLYVDRPGADDVLDRVQPLTDALFARKLVRFSYHGIQRDEVTVREVQPFGLFFQHGNWYLVGYDLGRSDIRVFRVGRMTIPEVSTSSPNTPDYQIPEDFSIDSHLQREAWELGDDTPVPVRVKFQFPRSLWAERNNYGALVNELEDGASVRELLVRQTNPLLRWVLSLGGEAEIITPVELADELRAMAVETAALYGEVRR